MLAEDTKPLELVRVTASRLRCLPFGGEYLEPSSWTAGCRSLFRVRNAGA